MKIKIFYILLLISLIFLKSDFRFTEDIYCCGDDHDYYMHSETISQDFDLDYNNQFLGIENKRYNKNDKIAPIGFFGSGLLASPFLFVGSLFNRVFESGQNNIFNYKILFYSMSSIFYLGLSIVYIEKTLKILKISQDKLITLLLYAGSGIFYFAFERYSMTHVYEVFTITMAIYYSARLFHEKTSNKKIDIMFIILSILLSFMVRWVNYFIVLIPLIVRSIKKPIEDKIKIDIKFLALLYSLFSITIFLLHTKLIYGIYTFDPRDIYGTNRTENIFDVSIVDFLISASRDFLIIIFTEEFGIFWFSPLIFLGLLISLINLLKSGSDKRLFSFLCLLSFAQTFGIVIVWGSVASSYGFRYLYCLIPLSLLIVSDFKADKIFIFRSYILSFSLFSTISILFFETTSGTQLSLDKVTNSFGNEVIYSQPNYLSGIIQSAFELNSYLIIFSTSLLGAIIFKLLISFFGINEIFDFLKSLSLPVENKDFQSLMSKLEIITFDKIFVSLLLIYLILKIIVREFTSNSIKKT